MTHVHIVLRHLWYTDSCKHYLLTHRRTTILVLLDSLPILHTYFSKSSFPYYIPARYFSSYMYVTYLFSFPIFFLLSFFFFFFNDTAPPEIYPLSLHDALPISPSCWPIFGFRNLLGARRGLRGQFSVQSE